ncbi:MAG: hypothetical protein ACRYFY_02755 [Janthinobacterium lividum]
MSPVEAWLSIFVSFSFSYFVTPLLISWIWHDGVVPLRPAGAIYWVTATGSNVLIPWTIRRIRILAGLQDDGGTDK